MPAVKSLRSQTKLNEMLTAVVSLVRQFKGGIRLSGDMSGEGYSQRSLVFGMCES